MNTDSQIASQNNPQSKAAAHKEGPLCTPVDYGAEA